MDRIDYRDRNRSIYNARVFGGKTLNQLAKEYELTPERIRQICSKQGSGHTQLSQEIRNHNKNSKIKVSRPKSPQEKFHKYFAEGYRSECWIWTGPVSRGGYPIVRYSGKAYQARRMVLEDRGIHLPDGYILSPSCGNRLCVNPRHLVMHKKRKTNA